MTTWVLFFCLKGASCFQYEFTYQNDCLKAADLLIRDAANRTTGGGSVGVSVCAKK
jgi:hypothetical protein